MYLHRIVVAQCMGWCTQAIYKQLRILYYYFKGYGSTNIYKCLIERGHDNFEKCMGSVSSLDVTRRLEASEDVLVVVGHLKSQKK